MRVARVLVASVGLVASALAVSVPRDALAEPAPVADCQPTPAPPTPPCAPPSDDMIQRAHDAADAITVEDMRGSFDATWSCPMARGYLVEVHVMPTKKARRVVTIPCDTFCGSYATFLVGAKGTPQQQDPVRILPALDVDGDGVADTITQAPSGRITVWLAAGAHRVTMPARGAFAPLDKGYAWLVADSDAVYGFAPETAHAYAITATGTKESKELRDQLWKRTLAARCPVADQDMIEPDSMDTDTRTTPAAPATPAAPVCAGPGADVKTRLAAQITGDIVASVRPHGHRVIGPPYLTWSCNSHDLAVLVDYCEAVSGGSCRDGSNGTHLYSELWTGKADHFTRYDHVERGIGGEEWAVSSQRDLVVESDLDGDGQPDPIIETSRHEGGSSSEDYDLEAFVGGRLIPIITSRSVKTYDTLGIKAIPHGVELVVQTTDDGAPPIKLDEKYVYVRAAHAMTRAK
jgi:hypothetical protein